jgi:hypothetical protein
LPATAPITGVVRSPGTYPDALFDVGHGPVR